MTDCLIVLAKEPMRGLSKTRLARDVGFDLAKRLAEVFVLDTLELARKAAPSSTLVAYAPPDAGPWFEGRAPWASLWPQPEGGFGHRIRSATRAAFDRGASRCVLVGMDTPHLRVETVDRAFSELGSADVCLGPALDGGYYLIGLSSDQPRLFEDIPWSTAAVARVTRERAREQSLRVCELPEEFDIDEGADLDRLVDALELRPDVAPATRALLAGPRTDPRS